MRVVSPTLIPILFLFLLQCVNCANILFFFGLSGRSHRITAWPLIEALAEKGHKVTFFSPHQPKKPTTHPNITEMTRDIFDQIGMGYDPVSIRLEGGVKAVDELWDGYMQSGILMCEAILKDKSVIDWANTASYDLVVVNGLFNDCGFGFAHKFNASTIMYGSSSLFQWWGDVYGIPEENYPEFHFHMPLKMTFLQQVWNTFTPLYWHAYRQWYYLPQIEAMIRPALNIPDMPSLFEMDQRSNLVFFNSHFSEEFPRSLPPSMIPIGGMHVSDKTDPLPESIQKFVEKWEEGFIYFSFGTYMRLPLLPQSHKDAFFGAIKKFPKIGFVIKWNGGKLPNSYPENAFLSEWLPQQSLLAHPNVRAFIAHGGLLGTQEAIFHAVPMIVFPIFAEQDYNAERIHGAERGIMMEISDLTEDKLERAIREILTNQKYKSNMERVSVLFKDRIVKPVDAAVWWTEYVLKHKDTSFLKPIGMTRTWYEKRMLHIWAFVSFVLLISAIVTFIFLRAICSLTLVNILIPKQNNAKVKSQ